MLEEENKSEREYKEYVNEEWESKRFIKKRGEEKSCDVEKISVKDVTRAINEEENEDEQKDRVENAIEDIEKLWCQITSLSIHLEQVEDEAWEY